MCPLSIVYITLNADHYLRESFEQSKKLSQDILILDSGSKDNTLSIAEEMGVKVIHQDWLGFSAQKQKAIDSALHNWVLFLDADEVLSDNAVTEIRSILQGEELLSAYSLPRQNWFQGKWIQHGSWWPDRVLRLVDRRKGQMKSVQVHEAWETTHATGVITGEIKHYSYQNYSQLIQKADTYSTLAAKQLYQDGKKSTQWQPLLHAIAAFIKLFVLKKGFLDGIEGAAIAYTSALASFMKYAKLQELNEKNQTHG